MFVNQHKAPAPFTRTNAVTFSSRFTLINRTSFSFVVAQQHQLKPKDAVTVSSSFYSLLNPFLSHSTSQLQQQQQQQRMGSLQVNDSYFTNSSNNSSASATTQSSTSTDSAKSDLFFTDTDPKCCSSWCILAPFYRWVLESDNDDENGNAANNEDVWVRLRVQGDDVKSTAKKSAQRDDEDEETNALFTHSTPFLLLGQASIVYVSGYRITMANRQRSSKETPQNATKDKMSSSSLGVSTSFFTPSAPMILLRVRVSCALPHSTKHRGFEDEDSDGDDDEEDKERQKEEASKKATQKRLAYVIEIMSESLSHPLYYLQNELPASSFASLYVLQAPYPTLFSVLFSSSSDASSSSTSSSSSQSFGSIPVLSSALSVLSHSRVLNDLSFSPFFIPTTLPSSNTTNSPQQQLILDQNERDEMRNFATMMLMQRMMFVVPAQHGQTLAWEDLSLPFSSSSAMTELAPSLQIPRSPAIRN